MRALWLAVVVGCSAAPPPSPRGAPVEAVPAVGSWRVELEVPGWVARPSAIAVDATGICVTGPAFRSGR